MKGRTIFLAVLLAVFTIDSALVLVEHGFLGFFELAMANTATQIMGFDLLICLGLIAAWMIGDARERGLSVAPYLAVTVVMGSAGPLLYLIRREWSSTIDALHYRPGVSQAEKPASH